MWEPICAMCGEDDDDLWTSPELLKTHAVVLPLCQDCKGMGATPVHNYKRSVNSKRKRTT